MNVLISYKDTPIYNRLNAFIVKKYNITCKILSEKPLVIQLGFILEFLYYEGYMVLATQRGFKLLSISDEHKLFPDAHKNELLLVENNDTVIINYFKAFSRIFKALNNLETVF